MFDKVPFPGPQSQVLNLAGASIFIKVHLRPRGSRPAPITGVALQLRRSSRRNGLPVGKLYLPQDRAQHTIPGPGSEDRVWFTRPCKNPNHQLLL